MQKTHVCNIIESSKPNFTKIYFFASAYTQIAYLQKSVAYSHFFATPVYTLFYCLFAIIVRRDFLLSLSHWRLLACSRAIFLSVFKKKHILAYTLNKYNSAPFIV